jgi:integrase
MPRPSRTGVRGLYRGKDGNYRIDLRWEDANGGELRFAERLPPGTPGAAAVLRAKEVLTLALSGKLAQSREDAAPTTLGAALKEYLKHCELNRPKSDPKYKQRHRDHWIKTLGDGFPIASLSELTIEKHKARRVGEGKEPGTVNRELVTFKHFLNRCVDWGWLEKRPKITLLEEPPPRVRWLTDPERAALASALAEPQRVSFRRVCSAALLSGQRLGKIIELQKVDVDLQRSQLTVRAMRKGGKVRTTHQPISAALAAVLTEAMADSEGSHVFAAGRGGEPYTRNGASSFFARICREAGITDLHFHDLRHDFATRLRRGGVGLDALQQLLGHATMAMTQRYAHIGSEELQAAVEKVTNALPPALPKPSRKGRKDAAKRIKQHAS